MDFKYGIYDLSLWDAFVDGRLAVNCRDKDELEGFLEVCSDLDMKWSTGLNALSYNPIIIGRYCCIVNKFRGKKGMSHASVDFYKERGLTVVPAFDIVAYRTHQISDADIISIISS